MHHPKSVAHVAVITTLLLTTAALAGCTNSSTAPLPATPSPSALILQNCDTSVTFETMPERVVTIKSSTTEMLLALGLGDRIIATAFQDGPVPEQWAADAAGLPVISAKLPSEEAVLDLEPDLVYAGWESAFTPDTAGDRAELAGLGIATFVSPAACRSVTPSKLTFDAVFGEIAQVASIFRVDASELIATQQSILAAVTSAAPGKDRSAFWYSSGTDTPYVGAGSGAPQLVLEAAGLSNIAGDVDATWAPFNWEAVVAADPYFIIVVDSDWNTAAAKIAFLESHPATANLTAVKSGRYITVPFAASEAGVRSVETAASIANQVEELDGP